MRITAADIVKDAYAALKQAEAMDCVCSSFVTQFQGCSCDKGKSRKTAKYDGAFGNKTKGQ